MDKQAYLQEVYELSFDDELEKVAKESIYDKDIRPELTRVFHTDLQIMVGSQLFLHAFYCLCKELYL